MECKKSSVFLLYIRSDTSKSDDIKLNLSSSNTFVIFEMKQSIFGFI